MPSTLYMLIDGIKGDSADTAHKDWIEAVAFTHSISVSIVTSGGSGGSAAGRAQEAFTITKLMDASSPQLYDLCTSGRHIKTVQVDFMRLTGDSAVKFMSVEMDDVILSSITTGSDPQGTATDRLSLLYSKIQWTPVRNLIFDQTTVKRNAPITLNVP